MMVNDTTTLNGALMELGELMAENLTTQGLVGVSASDGLTTLANDILLIQGGGGGTTTLFEDDATTDNSSQYTSYSIQGTSGAVNIGWNSTEQAYAITNNTTSGRALIQFGNTILQNNMKISADIKLGGTSYKQNGMLAFIDKDSQSTYSLAGWVQGEKYVRLVEFNGTNILQTTSNDNWSDLSTSDYNHHELTYVDGVVTYTVTTPSNNTKTMTLTLQQSNYIGGKTGLFVEVFSSATHCYIKNIKVETIGGSPLSPCSTYIAEIDNAIEYINGSGS